MTVPLELIKQLREVSGAGILDCRKALEQANADYDQALKALNEKGLIAAAKRSDRPVSQGVLELYSHGQGRVGVMVEINTETDFASRSQAFRSLAHEIALQIAAAAPQYVREAEIPAEVIEEETAKVVEKARADGKAEGIIPRIVEGSLKKFKNETVLMRQPYIRDETVTVEQLVAQAMASVGENIVVQRFVRWEMVPDVAAG